jgi:Protein of unknown function (Hypoth_ymh)
MDREAAFRKLTEHWESVGKAEKLPMLSKERRDAMKVVNARRSEVNTILSRLAPDLPLIHAKSLGEHLTSWPRLRRALDLFNGWRHMSDHQWTGGGPALPMTLLDPVIREVALPLWEAGKYRQAVSDAATNLNNFAQNRLVRHDISDKALMEQAFNDSEPEKGKSRLRCPGNSASETVKAQQAGARAFATGTFLAIRNPAHHMTGDWNPVTAFHHLVALSQVAHYFRDWEIERYIPPMPEPTEFNAVLGLYYKEQQKRKALAPPTD